MTRYDALRHAVKAHNGQLDKCGEPYILHPIAVAELVDKAFWRIPDHLLRGLGPRSGVRESLVIIALLHDVWEDTDYMIDPDDFTDAEWGALYGITRAPQETYAHYIESVSYSVLASLVKLADLQHNLSDARLKCLPDREADSLRKRYQKARQTIEGRHKFAWVLP